MNNSAIATVAIIVVLLLGALAWSQMSGTVSNTATTTVATTTGRVTSPATPPPQTATTTPTSTTTASTTASTTTIKTPAPVTVDISASNFEFSEKAINVKKGQRVTINFSNSEGTHDFVLDEFAGARTKEIGAGQSESITFVADRVGAFEYYCSVGRHREMGMVGSLVVSE